MVRLVSEFSDVEDVANHKNISHKRKLKGGVGNIDRLYGQIGAYIYCSYYNAVMQNILVITRRLQCIAHCNLQLYIFRPDL